MGDNIFGDFAAIRKEQAEWREKAATELLPGIDPAELKVGDKITISPNLRTGDRSGVTEVHTVEAVNSMHVQTRRKMFGDDWVTLLLTTEHHFYVANHFAEEGKAKEKDK